MIIGPAILDKKGDVWQAYKPSRHPSVILAMQSQGATPTVQGFAVFMTREQAKVWCKEQGIPHQSTGLKELYTEDLW